MKIKFKYIMLLLALSVAGCAAYFSVWGLSQLFAGASSAVIIMASVLEISKIVTTTALHSYWDKFNKTLKIYLSISVVILMLITSAGIYGFLSNAYQQTSNKLEIHEGEVSVLEAKKGIFEKGVVDNNKIIESKTKRIDQLSNLRTTQENRFDTSKNNRDKKGVRSDIASANNEIQKLSGDIDVLNIKNGVLGDSISKYTTKILELKAGSSVAAEVGPLKYISKLTGISMDSVVNYLILLLIFVFDPLAIALVLATNRIFELQGELPPLEPTPIDLIHDDEPINDDTPYDDYDEQPEIEDEEHFNNQPEEHQVEQEVQPEIQQEVIMDEPETTIEPEVVIEQPQQQQQQQQNKIQLEDIKEIKDRGFTVPIPSPNNVISRIGDNKFFKGR